MNQDSDTCNLCLDSGRVCRFCYAEYSCKASSSFVFEASRPIHDCSGCRTQGCARHLVLDAINHLGYEARFCDACTNHSNPRFFSTHQSPLTLAAIRSGTSLNDLLSAYRARDQAPLNTCVCCSKSQKDFEGTTDSIRKNTNVCSICLIKFEIHCFRCVILYLREYYLDKNKAPHFDSFRARGTKTCNICRHTACDEHLRVCRDEQGQDQFLCHDCKYVS